MSWQRTYRPKQVAGLHLSNIRETLLGFMKKGHIPQVMLFAGPKGTGKTSSARIIGAMLNDPQNEKIVDWQFFKGPLPKEKKYHEPDPDSDFNDRVYRGQSFVVQEMDAASNRGIDDIRDLKERISLPPQDGKMTVYILDEAHMLTTAAFNALLKLLEEPPAHAVFILATTELHKIPDTIKSRCSLLNFRKANSAELKQALDWVATAEKIKYQPAALEQISQLADGSFRDAVKLLEMVAGNGEVTTKNVAAILSASVDNDVAQLITLTLDKDETGVAELFESLRSRNVDEKFFLTSTLNFLHTCLLQNLGIKTGQPFTSQDIAMFLLKELSQVEAQLAPIAHLNLELKILELISRSGEKKKSRKKKSNLASSQASPILITKTSKKETPALDSMPSNQGDSQKLIDHWPDFLAAVKKENMTVEALLRSAKPLKGENGTAQVQVFYKFHKEQLELPRFKNLLKECAAPIAGGYVDIMYQLSTTPAAAQAASPTASGKNDLASLAQEMLV